MSALYMFYETKICTHWFILLDMATWPKFNEITLRVMSFYKSFDNSTIHLFVTHIKISFPKKSLPKSLIKSQNFSLSKSYTHMFSYTSNTTTYTKLKNFLSHQISNQTPKSLSLKPMLTQTPSSTLHNCGGCNENPCRYVLPIINSQFGVH